MIRKTGARGLRSIVEAALLDTMYDLPSMEDVEKWLSTSPLSVVVQAAADLRETGSAAGIWRIIHQIIQAVNQKGDFISLYFSVFMALNVWETSPYTGLHVNGCV